MKFQPNTDVGVRFRVFAPALAISLCVKSDNHVICHSVRNSKDRAWFKKSPASATNHGAQSLMRKSICCSLSGRELARAPDLSVPVCEACRGQQGDPELGTGALMIEANGLDSERHAHIREQMVELITITYA